MKTAIVALSLAFAAPAFAQNTRDEDVTEHTFDDLEQVEGGRNTAWGERLPARMRLPRHSLVRPRTQFIPELMKSVEDI